MKRLTLFAILLPVLLACERREESASAPSAPATQAAPQAASPPAASGEPAPAAPQTSTAEPTAPATGQTSATEPATTPATGQTSGASGDYTVAEGDTLSGIARQHGVSSRDLATWNDIEDPNRIHPGQTLRLAEPGS